MLKKFFVSALILIGFLGIGNINFANVNAQSIPNEFNLPIKPMTTGTYYWAKVVNCNEWISLRREPSTSSERIYKIPLGATVKIYRGMMGEHDDYPADFYRTYYNGSWGWCLREYIEIGAVAGYAP